MNKGFTLIEALIYIGLLGIMIGGGVVGVYNILEGSGRTREAMYREQDAYFITRKINNVLSQMEGGDEVLVPTVGSSADELIIQTDEGWVRIDLEAEQIWLQRGNDPEEELHDIFIKAEDISFESSTTINSIIATFTLDEHEYSVSHYMP